jgi:hypothetical protein
MINPISTFPLFSIIFPILESGFSVETPSLWPNYTECTAEIQLFSQRHIPSDGFIALKPFKH